MDRELWRRVEEVLDRVLDAPEAQAEALLDTLCGADDTLRAEVEALLAAARREEGLLEGEAAALLTPLLEGDPELETLPLESLAGRRIGPYRVEHLLGTGGMGEVWKAHDSRLERPVALKLLPREWSREPRAKERFLREARAASALDHPNILNVHELGETDDGQLYLVTAYYPGETLRNRLEAGPLPVNLARRIVVGVARGLERAHEAGIVHRDIKPGNVMLTERGEVKLLDFGIARIADEGALTRTGTLPGTPAYMSPEQVAGHPVDARSDLWSLGVLLYEMLTGQRPYGTPTGLATLRAIADEEPPRLEGEGFPEDLRWAVENTLVKDPERRLGSARELLEALETGTTTQVLAPPLKRRLAYLAPLLPLLLLVVVLAWYFVSPATEGPPSAPAQGAEASTIDSLAVLFFQNLTGDTELQWMQNGITDMLVANLSQSPEIRVLSTGRLHQILGELEAPDTDDPSFELARAVARRAESGAVLRGSFAHLGSVLRIQFTLEDAESGEILAADRFEGPGAESLFSLVDQVSAVVRQRLEGTAGAADLPAVEDVTTSSLEAWRLYSQGISLQHESRETEALPLLEQAIEIDPSFALALVAAGRIHANLNHPGRAREYTARGVELSDRLPLDQRFSIAATHYATTWSTYGRAIESFQEALRLDPEKAAWRNNLANLYAYLERYEEAERELMRLIEADTPFAPSYGTAADVLAAQGKLESGRALLEDFAARHPDNWYGQLVLGWYGIQENRPGAVEEHLAAAEALAPGNRHLEYVRWRLEILRGALDDAEGAAQRMVVQDDAYSRWRGHVSIARNRLYRGRATEALTHYDLATRAYGEPEAYTALAHTWKAELHLQLGQAEEARLEARTARRQAPGTWPELRGIFLEALAAAHLGDEATARALVDELEKRWQSQPNVVEERQLLHLKGRLALLRGDTPAALEALRKAAELLPPRGIEIHDYALPNHLPLWLALGEAELAAGNTEAALPWLTRAWESDSEHIMFPVVRMRAAFLLGRLHFERGEVEAARPVLEAYLRAWGDGDLDRGDVEAAERMLGSIRS